MKLETVQTRHRDTTRSRAFTSKLALTRSAGRGKKRATTLFFSYFFIYISQPWPGHEQDFSMAHREMFRKRMIKMKVYLHSLFSFPKPKRSNMPRNRPVGWRVGWVPSACAWDSCTVGSWDSWGLAHNIVSKEMSQLKRVKRSKENAIVWGSLGDSRVWWCWWGTRRPTWCWSRAGTGGVGREPTHSSHLLNNK